ncbi:MAG: tetratricopeptide repeat protein, partial [Acidobacteriota bacterium]|nr:tetratricopeptide repeat protein [Acidobacteriota bacterium]
MPRGRRDSLQVADKLVARGKIEPAIKEYTKVLHDNPSDTSTLNKVGDLYVRLKRMDKAIDLFRRAAEHFAQEELFVKAIAIYKKIIRLE